MGKLSEKEFIEYVKENSIVEPYPTKQKIAAEFDVNEKTVYRRANNPQPDVIEETEDNKATYYHIDNKSEGIAEEVNQIVDKLLNLLGSRRNPTIQEVANIGNFDVQNNEFRKAFTDLKKSKDLSQPSKEVRKEKNSKIIDKIVTSLLIDNGYIRYQDPEEEKEKQKEARQYLSNNELKDHIDVSYGGRNGGGKPDRVYIDFDKELEILLGKSTVSREI